MSHDDIELFKRIQIQNQDYSDLYNHLKSIEQQRNFTTNKSKLKELLSLLPSTQIVIAENFYVDKVFRSSYYNYYASKHFNVDRFCVRLCFFDVDTLELDDFYNCDHKRKLQDAFIGFTIIQPLTIGSIGRTYFNPDKISIKECYVRTTVFNLTILGAQIDVNTYPFSSQNSETMTCAETSLWTISEYYGNRYANYRFFYPNEISSIQSSMNYERSLPSRGLTYIQSSHILKSMGFFPRIYYRYKGANQDEEIYDHGEFKKLFHYYVESGIPFMAGIKGKNQNGQVIGHAVACIGHGSKSEMKVNPEKMGKFYFIDSSRYYKEYVINDDNQTPFKIEPFNRPSVYKESSFKYFIVPLYNRIFLEAKDAYIIVNEILTHEKYGIYPILENKSELGYSRDNPLVIRFFLTSSRKYKSFRAKNYPHMSMARVYTQMPLPKFIWVAELSLNNEFHNNQVFGEIILDATASRHSMKQALVSLHYPGYLGYRMPDEPISKLFERFEKEYRNLSGYYPLYINNLRKVDKE